MTKYEYKTVTFARKGIMKAKFDTDAELNRHGAEGWKVVGTYTAGVGVNSADELSFTMMREVK